MAPPRTEGAHAQVRRSHPTRRSLDGEPGRKSASATPPAKPSASASAPRVVPTHDLLEVEGLAMSYGDRKLFRDLFVSALAGREAGIARRQRQRQDHAAQKFWRGSQLPAAGAIDRATGFERRAVRPASRAIGRETRPCGRRSLTTKDHVEYQGRKANTWFSWAKAISIPARANWTTPLRFLSGGEKKRGS